MSIMVYMAQEVWKEGIKFYKMIGKEKRRVFPCKCYMCNKIRYLKKGKERTLCRECAYTVNAFRINGYIKRPERGPDGRYKKTNV
jgi:hypothetical protein